MARRANAATSSSRGSGPSTLRRFWIAWCLIWAAFWLGAAVYTVVLIPLPLAVLSLLAILLPVGSSGSETTGTTELDRPRAREYALVRKN